MSLRALPLMFLLAFGPAMAQEASSIRQVTLYPGSATVDRVARIAAGASQLEIGGLPAGFDLRTIRLDADAGIRLGEFTVQDVASADAVNPRQAALEAKIEALDDQLARLDIERQSAELVTGYLKGLGEGGKGGAVDTRNLAGTLGAIQQGGSEALARIQRVVQQKRGLEKQREALQRDLDKIAAGNRDSRRLIVSLAAERAGEVRLSYQLNGPGWQPVYRATLDSATGRVEIERQALIAQNSGEDWSRVALKLSTGQPRAAAQGQPPQAWNLYLREPQTVRPMAKAMMAPAPAAAPMAELARRSEVADAPLFEVDEMQTAFATEFEVPARISLPSDGRRVTVSLARQQLPMKLRVQVQPRQDTTAWLVASGERPAGVWLPGEVQLYRDGSYVGATRWSAQEGERFELPFGRDDLLRVVNKPGTQMNTSGGFIDQRREREISNEYTITSQHKQAVELLVLEASPVSTSEQIKVETKFVPQPDQLKWQDQPGIAAWSRTLAPGAVQKFSVSYKVSWPKEANVIGF